MGIALTAVLSNSLPINDKAREVGPIYGLFCLVMDIPLTAVLSNPLPINDKAREVGPREVLVLGLW